MDTGWYHPNSLSNAGSFYVVRNDLDEDPKGDGNDPEKDNDKKKRKKYDKRNKPKALEENITLKETNLQTHFADWKKLHDHVKMTEPDNILLMCPRCVAILEFKKLNRLQGAINPLNMNGILVYYCSKCFHRFSDLYANTFPHATIENVIKWSCYAAQFQDKVKILEFPK